MPSSSRGNAPTLIRKRIERKMKLLRGEIDDRKIASLYRSLLRAGFPSDLIRRELRSIRKEEVPDAGDAFVEDA